MRIFGLSLQSVPHEASKKAKRVTLRCACRHVFFRALWFDFSCELLCWEFYLSLQQSSRTLACDEIWSALWTKSIRCEFMFMFCARCSIFAYFISFSYGLGGFEYHGCIFCIAWLRIELRVHVPTRFIFVVLFTMIWLRRLLVAFGFVVRSLA